MKRDQIDWDTKVSCTKIFKNGVFALEIWGNEKKKKQKQKKKSRFLSHTYFFWILHKSIPLPKLHRIKNFWTWWAQFAQNALKHYSKAFTVLSRQDQMNFQNRGNSSSFSVSLYVWGCEIYLRGRGRGWAREGRGGIKNGTLCFVCEFFFSLHVLSLNWIKSCCPDFTAGLG